MYLYRRGREKKRKEKDSGRQERLEIIQQTTEGKHRFDA